MKKGTIISKKGIRMNKELSIIIPVYNTPLNLLDRTLKSIDSDLVDIIIINDGSNHETSEYVERFSKPRSNVKLVNQSNQGAAMARKNGLDYLSTKYFTFVDCDDVSHVDKLLKLLNKMKEFDSKIGNGRVKCYLPGFLIGFNSKKWNLEHIDFTADKSLLGNVTCTFWDKIYHEDLAPIIQIPSTHTQYHDMEVVYPTLIKAGSMVHTNDIIYDYKMRANSSHQELSPESSLSIRKILESYNLMVEILKENDIYYDYKNEIDSIIVKLLYQRMRRMINNKNIKNKVEMASLYLKMIECIVPGYTNNIYYKDDFKDSELNDRLSFIQCSMFIKNHGLRNTYNNETIEELLKQYDDIIVLK